MNLLCLIGAHRRDPNRRFTENALGEEILVSRCARCGSVLEFHPLESSWTYLPFIDGRGVDRARTDARNSEEV